ncbi:TPA: hypothetical protein ACH3X1_010252 [Trebouxia sp. C0004]
MAMDPSALQHQHGISLDQLSGPDSVVAQAAQAIIADFDSMMHASDDVVASTAARQSLGSHELYEHYDEIADSMPQPKQALSWGVIKDSRHHVYKASQ